MPEREPKPFEEAFAHSAPEDILRAHFAANGDVPYEEVAPSPQPKRLSAAGAPGSAHRKSLTGTVLPSPKARQAKENSVGANTISPTNGAAAGKAQITKRGASIVEQTKEQAKLKQASRMMGTRLTPRRSASAASSVSAESDAAEETKAPKTKRASATAVAAN